MMDLASIKNGFMRLVSQVPKKVSESNLTNVKIGPLRSEYAIQRLFSQASTMGF